MVGIPAIIDHIIGAWTRMTGNAPKHDMSTAPVAVTGSINSDSNTSNSNSSNSMDKAAPPAASMDETSMDAHKKKRVM